MFMSLQKLLNKSVLNKPLLNNTLFNKSQFIQKKIVQFFRPESDNEVKRLQYFWTACGGVGFLMLSYGLVTFLFSANPLKQIETPKSEGLLIETALSKVDIYDAWRHKIEDLLDKLSQRLESFEKTPQGRGQHGRGLDEGLKEGQMGAPLKITQGENSSDISEEEKLARNLNDKSDLGLGDPLMGGPLVGEKGEAPLVGNTNQKNSGDTRLSELEDKLLQLEMKLMENRSNDSYGVQDSVANNMNSNNTSAQAEGSVIQKVTLGLVDGPHHKLASKRLPNTVETTIPAGAFAKTVLLSGLDASSAMSASSDPRPMLLRIIDHGTLPRRFQSDLKDCHCTAGAYGDLSSERVYARLEKLTCVERSTGEIIETQVAGYVAGADGKAGIRGVVASKDGQFLARSLMGGIFSGLSNVANPQNRKAQVNPFVGGVPGAGAQMAGPSIGENFTAGMAGGATTALDRLSQYYIDRAEQLQPVIQIAAGQVVDIVFTMGTFIGSQSIQSEIEHRDGSQDESLRDESLRSESCRGDACSQNHQLSTQ